MHTHLSSSKIVTATPDSYNQLARALGNHGCVIVPTETVYGIAARADSAAACERIYKIKGRSFDKPLPVCVTSLEMAETLAQFSPLARELAQTFWPGPLTLVLPIRGDAAITQRAQSRAGTIALRHPDCGWAAHLAQLGWPEPLALTSANPSGAPSPTSAQMAYERLSEPALRDIDLILDDGPCNDGPCDDGFCGAGRESTILAISPKQENNRQAQILRQGALAKTAFEPFNINWINP